MKPLYLYSENFTCYKSFELHLAGISSALIVGRQDNNELESNGIGKTSIFRAIEYVLFAQTKHPVLGKDIVLEKLIQDEAAKLLVVFDFEIDNQVYRITRARTRKGSTDLTFFKRNVELGNPHTPITDKKLWTDLTCRRTADTDDLIYKLIRIKYKSFINTNHSMQLDMGGIATATPEKRRAILKDIFDLTPYAGMEKIAKLEADKILEDVKLNKALLDAIGSPATDIETIKTTLLTIDQDSTVQTNNITQQKTLIQELNTQQLTKTASLSALEKASSSIITRKASLTDEVFKLTNTIADYDKKRKAIIIEAKAITTSLTSTKKAKEELAGIDFTYLPKLNQSLEATTLEINAKTIEIGIIKAELEELNIPMPDDGTCKHCRQELTPAHRRACMDEIERQIEEKSKMATALTGYIKQLKVEQAKYTSNIKQLEQQEKQVADLTTSITAKVKELNDKQQVHNEYNQLLQQFNADLLTKQADLLTATQEAESSSTAEIQTLTNELNKIKATLIAETKRLDQATTTFNSLQSRKAVSLHSIEEKQKDITKQATLLEAISKLETQYANYPYVIQAFASIPDMIIENVVEGLQEETNKLLAQIRPELQLEFATEKTRSDGNKDDTLDINYYLNNKPKDYSQLSGAQQLCVMFAFKLGLSFLLDKMNGCQIKFLMLDEVDMPFSHAAVDAYADIIRHFQKDFTVLVITHNERLKAKFSNAILVEQDGNGVSRAKVVSSW